MFDAMLQEMADNWIRWLTKINKVEQTRAVSMKLIALFIFHATDVHVYERLHGETKLQHVTGLISALYL